MRRACDQCLGTDCQQLCEQGQCYAEHQLEEQRQHDADMQRRYEEEHGGEG